MFSEMGGPAEAPGVLVVKPRTECLDPTARQSNVPSPRVTWRAVAHPISWRERGNPQSRAEGEGRTSREARSSQASSLSHSW